MDASGVSLRRVAEKDRAAGQLPDDPEPSMFLIYPEGIWIEVDKRSPHLSIGATAYGKSILDRALDHAAPLGTAPKLACLSIDSTRFSSSDVGFPLDMTTLAAADRAWRQAHYDCHDLSPQRTWWNAQLTKLAGDMPDGP